MQTWGVLNSPFQGLSEYPPPPPQPDTQRAQMRPQRHQPLKTLRVGRKPSVPERYLFVRNSFAKLHSGVARLPFLARPGIVGVGKFCVFSNGGGGVKMGAVPVCAGGGSLWQGNTCKRKNHSVLCCILLCYILPSCVCIVPWGGGIGHRHFGDSFLCRRRALSHTVGYYSGGGGVVWRRHAPIVISSFPRLTREVRCMTCD